MAARLGREDRIKKFKYEDTHYVKVWGNLPHFFAKNLNKRLTSPCQKA